MHLTITLTDEQLDQLAERVAALLVERQPANDAYLNATDAAAYLVGEIPLIRTSEPTPGRSVRTQPVGRRLLNWRLRASGSVDSGTVLVSNVGSSECTRRHLRL